MKIRLFLVILFFLSILSTNIQAKSFHVNFNSYTIKEDSLWGKFKSLIGVDIIFSTVELAVKVIDSTTGTPVDGAAVMVGDRVGEPFAGKIVYTNYNGEAVFLASEIGGLNNFPVSIFAQGYTYYTVFDITPGELVVYVEPINDQYDRALLRGKFSGYPQISQDNRIDAGIFIPMPTLQTLIRGDFSSFIGPPDTIDIYGEREIPGNIVAPKQKEYYGIIPLKLDKPYYKMYAKNNQTVSFLANSLSAPFK
jgi:hypothetical protein